MTTPVKAINKKVCVLEVDWVAVEDVLVQLTAVVVDDSGWRLFKMGQKISKGCRGDSCDRITSNP